MAASPTKRLFPELYLLQPSTPQNSIVQTHLDELTNPTSMSQHVGSLPPVTPSPSNSSHSTPFSLKNSSVWSEGTTVSRSRSTAPNKPKGSADAHGQPQKSAPASSDPHIPAVARHIILSRGKHAAVSQAPRDCWEHLLPFPQTAPNEVDRAAWWPFVEALGLQRKVYPAIEVEGKGKQSRNCGSDKKPPNWNFLAYVLIAVSPKGVLTQREIYHLCLAWCPELNPNNNSCRHSLCISNKKKEELELFSSCYRLRDVVGDKAAPMSASMIADPKITSSGLHGRGETDLEYGSAEDGSPSLSESNKATGGQKRKRSIFHTNNLLNVVNMQDTKAPASPTRGNRKHPRTQQYKNHQVSQKIDKKDNGAQESQGGTYQQAFHRRLRFKLSQPSPTASAEHSMKAERASEHLDPISPPTAAPAMSTTASVASAYAGPTSVENIEVLRRREYLLDKHLKQHGRQTFLGRPTVEWLEQVRVDIEIILEGGFVQRERFTTSETRHSAPRFLKGKNRVS